MDCIVVHAADVSTSDKEKKRKTDKVDALKLARNLAAGELKGIHVPDENSKRKKPDSLSQKISETTLTEAKTGLKAY